jgi:hypothetical protein
MAWSVYYIAEWMTNESEFDFGQGHVCVMSTALFWAITQRVVVIPYRLFGNTDRSHLKGSGI